MTRGLATRQLSSLRLDDSKRSDLINVSGGFGIMLVPIIYCSKLVLLTCNRVDLVCISLRKSSPHTFSSH